MVENDEYFNIAHVQNTATNSIKMKKYGFFHGKCRPFHGKYHIFKLRIAMLDEV